MIDQELINTVSKYVLHNEPLKPELSEELLNNYIALIEQNAELHKKLAQFNTAITDIGKHIQKSEPSFCMGGVDSKDGFSSSGKVIGYIEKIEGK